ncbi:MAG TPA: putative zinc-binding protein [Methanobacterium sp.]|nr:putative zinc-binding protein [Methanobacterium sp.]
MTSEKIALAPCSGMSPYGLITRAASVDTVKEHENLISLCMGATSADREGFKELIRKYPIIAINGCEGSCVNKILKQKGVEVAKTINAMETLDEEDLRPTDVVRLDDEGEKCVLIMKKKINELLE